MKSVYNIFKKLKEELPLSEDIHAVAPVPSSRNHKIGITQSGQPIYFIKCENTTKSISIDTNLEFITVQYNRHCQLTSSNRETDEGVYTIIILKADVEYLQEYFINVVYILLTNLSEKPVVRDLKIEIDKLINLFSKFTKPPLKTVQGLWAELLIIEQSKNPDYLIRSWHSSISDKYDFNDGADKIEVKSTQNSRRMHSFSLEQLMPNKSSLLLVASVLVKEAGLGTNVFDLIKKIETRIRDKNLSFRINELVAQTLGNDINKSIDVFFDYQYALDSIQYYLSSDIPSIRKNCIPSNIINLKYDCDLSGIKTIDKNTSKSMLHNSLL